MSLAILGYVLQEQQRKRADNETKEEVLQTYFDRLSVLLIDQNLIALSNKSNSSTITSEDRELLDSSLDVIRARTLSILRRFEKDAERKTSVIKFLIETEIVGKSKLNLQWANLKGANLKRANLQGANLEWADLSGAELQGANLRRAKLNGAKLEGANLEGASLVANLKWADLKGTNLEGANLKWADLYGADLSRADLYVADLSNADLRSAKLSGAKLQGANLEDTKWDSETVWPDKRTFANARNIPEELKIKLGITP